MTQERRIENFQQFWPFYLGEHRHPLNRMLHFIGSTAALICFLLMIVRGRLWLLPLGLLIGYGCAWIGHFLIERNQPASFKYPLWSFMADWKMWGLMLTGRLHHELHQLSPTSRA